MHKTKRILLASACILSLSACESFKDYVLPNAPQGVSEVVLDKSDKDIFAAANPVGQWWSELKDDTLSALIGGSLERNKDVQIAMSTLKQARALRAETQFDRWPTVRSSGSYSRTLNSRETVNSTGQDRTTNLYDAGLDASWELDIFGRVSARVASAKAAEAVAEANLRDVHVLIAAEMASTYIELRGAQHRLNIAKRNANNQKQTYDLSVNLANAGRNTQLDVVRAETQLELTRSTIPALEAAVNANMNRLSVLTGQVPDALKDSLSQAKPIPSTPHSVNVGNVSDLLRRRPDIQRAEKAFEASIADYNVSVADQFPVVQIMGNLGFLASNFGSFGASALTGSIAPQVSWAALDMGRVRQQINQKDALSQTALFEYEKTVLEALEDLQTSMHNFVKEEERRARLQKAARLSKEAAELARERYRAGLDAFIDVLNAEATLLQAEDSLAQSEINSALALIAIYKALGGGWEL